MWATTILVGWHLDHSLRWCRSRWYVCMQTEPTSLSTNGWIKIKWSSMHSIQWMCSLLILFILTSIFKSSLNELKDSKQGIFGRELPLPIKTLPVFSMAADGFYEDCVCNDFSVRFTWHKKKDHNSCGCPRLRTRGSECLWLKYKKERIGMLCYALLY